MFVKVGTYSLLLAKFQMISTQTISQQHLFFWVYYYIPSNSNDFTILLHVAKLTETDTGKKNECKLLYLHTNHPIDKDDSCLSAWIMV